MSSDFSAVPNPTHDLLHAVGDLAPANPFYALPFVEAKRASGWEPWVLVERRDGETLAGCTAFMQSGRLVRTLQIPSIPSTRPSEAFWHGLLEFCRSKAVWNLQISNLASHGVALPQLRGQTSCHRRFEYILDLRGDLWAGLSHGHRYSIKRAQKAGLQLRTATGTGACREHARLRSDSMARRKQRGESVPERIDSGDCEVYLRTGAGRLFQAVRGDEVLSSYLVLLGRKGAYLQSGGASRTGMACGASQFLIYETARLLQRESMESLSLGGAHYDNPGLVTFKLSFGARPVRLETACFCLAHPVIRKGLSAIRQLREDPLRFLHGFVERLERFVAYSADPADLPAPGTLPNVTFEKLTDDALKDLPTL